VKKRVWFAPFKIIEGKLKRIFILLEKSAKIKTPSFNNFCYEIKTLKIGVEISKIRRGGIMPSDEMINAFLFYLRENFND